MNDRVLERIGSMLDIDIKAFKQATPYSELEIIKGMIYLLEHRKRKIEVKNTK